MLDKAGARMHEARQTEAIKKDPFGTGQTKESPFRIPVIEVEPPPKYKVRFVVTETHDGEPCECIDQEITIGVGDSIELTHTCHDGRVDKVIGKLTEIVFPVEHGSAGAHVRVNPWD